MCRGTKTSFGNTYVSDLSDILVKRRQELTQREKGTRLVVKAISSILNDGNMRIANSKKKKDERDQISFKSELY